MTTTTRINLLHLWSTVHPLDFIKRVEDLLTDLYERLEAAEWDVHQLEGEVKRMRRNNE